MNIKELKELLTNIIDRLQKLNENEKVEIYYNSYWVKSNLFLSTEKGFIDLDNPTNDK